MEITATDYEWLLATVEAFHRAESSAGLAEELLTRAAGLGARGWLEADAEGRWLGPGLEAAGWRRCPGRGAAAWVWRERGETAMAMGWCPRRKRWVGWWMQGAPGKARALAGRLLPALLTAYGRGGWAGGKPGPVEVSGFTKREAEVAHWIAQGKTDREVGRILGISDRTVGKHRDNIFAKAGVETRTALARWLLAP